MGNQNDTIYSGQYEIMIIVSFCSHPLYQWNSSSRHFSSAPRKMVFLFVCPGYCFNTIQTTSKTSLLHNPPPPYTCWAAARDPPVCLHQVQTSRSTPKRQQQFPIQFSCPHLTMLERVFPQPLLFPLIRVVGCVGISHRVCLTISYEQMWGFVVCYVVACM